VVVREVQAAECTHDAILVFQAVDGDNVVDCIDCDCDAVLLREDLA